MYMWGPLGQGCHARFMGRNYMHILLFSYVIEMHHLNQPQSQLGKRVYWSPYWALTVLELELFGIANINPEPHASRSPDKRDLSIKFPG